MRGFGSRSSLLVFVLVSACGGTADPLEEPTPPDGDVELDTEAASKPPPDANAPAKGRVTFARDATERVFGIHIRDKAHTRGKVIYSVRLPNLSSSERLRLRAEVALSRCNPKDIAGLSSDSAVTPCNSKDMQRAPYAYAPHFGAVFVLGDSASDANGERVSQWIDTPCSEGQHHCALALPEVVVDELPDAAEKYLNLVVAADAGSHAAKSWHVMEVEQHHGALAVTRMDGAAAGAPVLQESSNQLRSKGAMGVDRPEEDGDPTQVRRLMYQVELTGLHPGDVVDADARMRAYVGNYSCDPLITGEIVLTAKEHGWNEKGNQDERITIKNGRNCSDHSKDGCKYEKSGAVQLDKDTPQKLYASYVAVALRSCADPSGGDRWWADAKEGFLDVRVRR